MAALALLATVWIAGFVNAFNFMDGVNGIFRRARHAGRGGVRTARLVAAGRVPARLRRRAGGRRAGLPAVERRPRPGVPGGRGQLRAGRGGGGTRRLRGLHCTALPPEAGPRPGGAVPDRHRVDAVPAGPARERLLEAHRGHVYQRWTDAGWSHQRVTAIAVAASAFLSLAGLVSVTGPLAAGWRPI